MTPQRDDEEVIGPPAAVWTSPVLLIARSLSLAAELQDAGGPYAFTTVCAFDVVRRRIGSHLWRAVVVDASAPPNVSADRLGRVISRAQVGTPLIVWGGDTRYGRVLSQILHGASRPWRAVDRSHGVEAVLAAISSVGAS